MQMLCLHETREPGVFWQHLWVPYSSHQTADQSQGPGSYLCELPQQGNTAACWAPANIRWQNRCTWDKTTVIFSLSGWQTHVECCTYTFQIKYEWTHKYTHNKHTFVSCISTTLWMTSDVNPSLVVMQRVVIRWHVLSFSQRSTPPWVCELYGFNLLLLSLLYCSSMADCQCHTNTSNRRRRGSNLNIQSLIWFVLATMPFWKAFILLISHEWMNTSLPLWEKCIQDKWQ